MAQCTNIGSLAALLDAIALALGGPLKGATVIIIDSLKTLLLHHTIKEVTQFFRQLHTKFGGDHRLGIVAMLHRDVGEESDFATLAYIATCIMTLSVTEEGVSARSVTKHRNGKVVQGVLSCHIQLMWVRRRCMKSTLEV